MELFLTYLLFIVGVILIVKGGDWFVDGAVWVAEVTKIPKFIIGATIVSLATTLPEIIVSVIAAIDGHKLLAAGNMIASQGKVGMAIGNGIGSVICNTAMILALSAVFMPTGIKRKDFAPKASLLITAVLTLFLFSLKGSLSIIGAVVLLLIFALYIFENVRAAKGNNAISSVTEEIRPEVTKKSLTVNVLRIVVGAAFIVLGSQLLVNNGSKIAVSWGVSEAIIGVTIIAIGTSLPELVTAIASIVKKQSSMSVGNVIGANVIDTTLILATCSFIYGGSLPVSTINMYLDFPVAILVSLIAVVPTIITKKFNRWQGIVLLAIYAGYLYMSIAGYGWYLTLFGTTV